MGIDIDYIDRSNYNSIIYNSESLYDFVLSLRRNRHIDRRHINISCKSGCKLTEQECDVICFFHVYIFVLYEKTCDESFYEIYKKHIPVIYKDRIVRLPVKALSPTTRSCITIVRYMYTRYCLMMMNILQWFKSFRLQTGKCSRNNRIFIMCTFLFPDVWGILTFYMRHNDIEPPISLQEYKNLNYVGLNTDAKIYTFLERHETSSLGQKSILSYIFPNKK